jgi:protein phosphatase
VGLVRTNNEDNFIVNPDLSKDDWNMPETPDTVVELGKNGCLLVVADGMGGMNAGEVASELAVQGVRRAFSEVKDFSAITDSSSHIEDFLKKVIVDADSDIKDKVKQDPSTEGMGTTIVMAWILGEMVHVAWCGDSRAYLFNRQSGLSRISRDHSYVQELVDSGKLDPELAFDHPNSNIITRSLGDCPDRARPDYVSRGLSAGDYIMLCSDGLCGLVRDDNIMAVLMQEHDTLEEYENDLFSAALGEGGHDNITIALFECVSAKNKTLSSTLGLTQDKKKAAAVAAASAASAATANATAESADADDKTEAPAEETAQLSDKPSKKRRGIGWIVLLLLVAAVVAFCWIYPDKAKDVKTYIENVFKSKESSGIQEIFNPDLQQGTKESDVDSDATTESASDATEESSAESKTQE